MHLNPLAFLKERGIIEAATPDCERYLMEESPKVYLGVDPTAESLHLGNLQGFIAAKWLEKMGCRITLLIGDLTASVGDPSGKMTERTALKDEKIRGNSSAIRNWIEQFMGPSVHLVNNHDWFGEMQLTTYLREIGQLFRMGPMLGKEWIRRRIQSEAGMSYTEFSYQLLQAYDFLYLFQIYNIRLQIGGSDQWGNITAGCELIRKKEREGTHAFVWPLLIKEDGTKFGKTEEGPIWLDSTRLSPPSFYQKVVGFSDKMVSLCFRRLTFLSLEEIDKLEQTLSKRDLQHRLAEELTAILHGEKGRQDALAAKRLQMEKNSLNFSFQELEKAKTKSITPSIFENRNLMDFCLEFKWVGSKSEYRRLVKQGAVKVNERQVIQEDFFLQKQPLIEGYFLIIALGKKKRFILKVSSEENDKSDLR